MNTETWIKNLEPKIYGSTEIAFPFPVGILLTISVRGCSLSNAPAKSLGSQKPRQQLGGNHTQKSHLGPFPPTNPFGSADPSDAPFYSPTAATAAVLAESRTMDLKDKRVLRGDFIKVSKPARARSPTRGTRGSYEAPFQSSLTDSQMERLSGG